MMIFTAIVRFIGLPACLVVGLLFFYEGIPGASHIPFLTSVPVLGDLTTGRVAVERARAAAEAKRQCVQEVEWKSQQAQLAERNRQEKAAAIAAEENRRRLAAARAAEAATADRLEQEISAHERELKALGRSCSIIDNADRDWLLKP